MHSKHAGFSLMEVVIAIAVIGIFFAAAAAVFVTLGKGVMVTRTRTVANSLAQEKIESLKDISYPRLRVTSLNDYATYGYDAHYYPPETGILVGDIPYERRILVQRVAEDGSGHLQEVLPDAGDTGLKKITVTVIWQEEGKSHSLSLSNHRGNPNRRPLDGTISGTVKDKYNMPLSETRLVIIDNITWNATTEADGTYTIRVPTGTYQVRASKDGYWEQTSATLSVGEEVPTPCNFILEKMAEASATGYVFINDHMVISKVVGSTVTALGENLEWVELYNPTTFPILIGSSFNLTYKDNYGLDHNLNTGSFPALQIINDIVPPSAYYLIANTGTVTLGAYTVNADAQYTGDFMQASGHRGSVSISYPDGGTTKTDTVGWKTASNSAPACELQPVIDWPYDGLQDGETLERCSYPGYYFHPSLGSAFDSDNNASNFQSPHNISSIDLPRTSTATCPPVSGYPAYGAIISCNDGVSAPTISSMTDPTGNRLAYFVLPHIATGTWTVSMFFSSGTYRTSREFGNVQLLTDGQFRGIPDAVTVSSWPVSGFNYAILNGACDTGFIAGTIKDSSGGIPGIKVEAGTNATYSTSGGTYLLKVPAGVYTVFANAGNLNADYTSQFVENITVADGEITSGVDLDISPGGALGGRVISNAGDYLPDVIVNAYDLNGKEYSTQTDSNGIFLITNLPAYSVPYTVAPSIDNSESYEPDEGRTVQVTKGVTQWTDTSGGFSSFTVTSAFGTFEGTVRYNGTPINTGVLIIATTATITAIPPDIDDALRTSGTPYYGTVSHANGSFSLQVRGGTAYSYNIYAWYATSATRQPQMQPRTGKTVAAGGKTTVEFTWP